MSEIDQTAGQVRSVPSAHFERPEAAGPSKLAAQGGRKARPTPIAVQFDPQRRAARRDFVQRLKSLALHLETTEARLGLRQRRRTPASGAKFRVAVETIACNLVALMLTGSELPLAVPRRSGVMWSAKRYRPEVYGQHFLDVLDLMTHPEIGLARIVTRGFRLESGRSQQTTIRPTQGLLDAIDFRSLDWSAMTRLTDPEVLILHGPKDARTGQAGSCP